MLKEPKKNEMFNGFKDITKSLFEKISCEKSISFDKFKKKVEDCCENFISENDLDKSGYEFSSCKIFLSENENKVFMKQDYYFHSNSEDKWKKSSVEHNIDKSILTDDCIQKIRNNMNPGTGIWEFNYEQETYNDLLNRIDMICQTKIMEYQKSRNASYRDGILKISYKAPYINYSCKFNYEINGKIIPEFYKDFFKAARFDSDCIKRISKDKEITLDIKI